MEDYTALLQLLDEPDFGTDFVHHGVRSTGRIHLSTVSFKDNTPFIDALSRYGLPLASSEDGDLVALGLKMALEKLVKQVEKSYSGEGYYLNLLPPNHLDYVNTRSEGVYMFIDRTGRTLKAWLEVNYEIVNVLEEGV
ncbi:MAG: hypothetical protein GY928_29730 [Colwellia sp.]|nr:hypothetical protein [Colwellia sp.]